MSQFDVLSPSAAAFGRIAPTSRGRGAYMKLRTFGGACVEARSAAGARSGTVFGSGRSGERRKASSTARDAAPRRTSAQQLGRVRQHNPQQRGKRRGLRARRSRDADARLHPLRRKTRSAASSIRCSWPQSLQEGVVTLTATARVFSRRMPPFMPPLPLAAIAPSPRRGTGGVSSGRSDGVACRRCCRWRRGWTEIVALNRAT